MDAESEHIAARVLVSGRVQGVFFRASTCEMARDLGLTGWVRNRPDGKVEAVFEGPGPSVRRMVSWCHHGPRLAEVTSVDLTWRDATDKYAGFGVRY